MGRRFGKSGGAAKPSLFSSRTPERPAGAVVLARNEELPMPATRTLTADGLPRIIADAALAIG